MKNKPTKINSIMCLYHEMIPENGEDSFYYDGDKNSFIVAVFDGLGGSGSKKYVNYSGKTGAYIASRAVCGAVKSWYDESRDGTKIGDYITRSLNTCKMYADPESRLRGSLGKAFPTTAAILKGSFVKNTVETECMWAGDSRCYMLDRKGLHQLTEDDLDVKDAFDNLTADGVMTNVINASSPFTIHNKKFTVTENCILFSSTDGCFNYLKSPMEFEYMLLDTLMKSNSVTEWRDAMDSKLESISGDDYTLCAAILGFDSFESIKKHFSDRYDMLCKEYINCNSNAEILWIAYKKDYSLYLDGGETK